MSTDEIKVIDTAEYDKYLAALCRLASGYVSRIRVQFAEKAREKYGDPTVCRIVLAYGEECEKLDAARLNDFLAIASRSALNPDWLNHPDCLEDPVLNKARSYGDTIKMLFDIE